MNVYFGLLSKFNGKAPYLLRADYVIEYHNLPNVCHIKVIIKYCNMVRSSVKTKRIQMINIL